MEWRRSVRRSGEAEGRVRRAKGLVRCRSWAVRVLMAWGREEAEEGRARKVWQSLPRSRVRWKPVRVT